MSVELPLMHDSVVRRFLRANLEVQLGDLKSLTGCSEAIRFTCRAVYLFALLGAITLNLSNSMSWRIYSILDLMSVVIVLL